LLNFPILLGSHKAKPSEWARLPSAEALHLRRLRENFSLCFANKICLDTVTQRAVQPKQKSELPQGAGIASKP
jgi:hypothetical protein